MMKILEYWKSAATTVVVLAGMVWGAVTWADEIVRNAKSVPRAKGCCGCCGRFAPNGSSATNLLK